MLRSTATAPVGGSPNPTKHHCRETALRTTKSNVPSNARPSVLMEKVLIESPARSTTARLKEKRKSQEEERSSTGRTECGLESAVRVYEKEEEGNAGTRAHARRFDALCAAMAKAGKLPTEAIVPVGCVIAKHHLQHHEQKEHAVKKQHVHCRERKVRVRRAQPACPRALEAATETTEQTVIREGEFARELRASVSLSRARTPVSCDRRLALHRQHV